MRMPFCLLDAVVFRWWCRDVPLPGGGGGGEMHAGSGEIWCPREANEGIVIKADPDKHNFIVYARCFCLDEWSGETFCS